MTRERMTCECGGQIDRPIPSHCPHCGARIVGVRRTWLSLLLPPLIVVDMFASVVLMLLG